MALCGALGCGSTHTSLTDDLAVGDFASVDDLGAVARSKCTDQYGTALTIEHGRLDGYLVSIVQPDAHHCNGDTTHLHLQVKMNNAIYDVAANVGDGTTVGSVMFAEYDGALANTPWSEGWSTNEPLDYSLGLGKHFGDFALVNETDLVKRINDELATVNEISIFATGYSGEGVHLVHRNANNNDGAIVINPLSATPHYLLFAFPTDSF